MKEDIEQRVAHAAATLCRRAGVPQPQPAELQVERCRNPAHGDFASNAAMILAARLRQPPRRVAEQLQQELPGSAEVARTEIAGPGFLNFFLHDHAWHDTVRRVLQQGDAYGHSRHGAGQRILLEFVSANPTGPLHVGHGRGAAYGDTLARLLLATGYRVHREYYVNDTGRQVDILGLSIWLRYLQQCGRTTADFPRQAYQGDYINELAGRLPQQLPAVADAAATTSTAMATNGNGEDAEAELDRLLALAMQTLGEMQFRAIVAYGVEAILEDIRQDLDDFGVCFDTWSRESAIRQQGCTEQALGLLQRNGYLYRRDGATWFRAVDFGDDKDRVVMRDNGQLTYFAADVAYHLEKYRRGHQQFIDVWGADHHGYVQRLRAALGAAGCNTDALEVLLVQFVALYRNRERLPMSTRSGSYVTLRELRSEVGSEAARFFYVMHSNDQALDFDLDLAKSHSNDNPVYYVQYAHTRICSVLRRANADAGDDIDLALLAAAEERTLMVEIARFPEVVLAAARRRQPHLVVFFLRELAAAFHGYYNRHQLLVEQAALRHARLQLAAAVAQVLRNGLALLGIRALEQM